MSTTKHVLVIAGALVAGTTSARAAAHVDFAIGYADQTSGTWALRPDFSYNPTGAPIVFTRLGVGDYQYRFDKANTGTGGGNFQARSHGNHNRCTVASWGTSGSDVTVHILCTTPAGVPFDTVSIVQYYGASGGDALDSAYLWADQPTAASYIPAAAWSYNSSGATNAIAHGVAKGEYLVHLPGLAGGGGNPHVTAYGPLPGYCKIESWYHLSGGTFLTVRCFDATGAPVDARYALRYTSGHTADDNRFRATYLYGDGNFGPDNPAGHTYTPAPQWHSGGLIDTVFDDTRFAIATVSGFVLGIGASTTTMVSAVGHDNTYCTSGGWYPELPDHVHPYAACYDPDGNDAGSPYTLAFWQAVLR